jgi:tyrosyl-tRNA synthetase
MWAMNQAAKIHMIHVLTVNKLLDLQQAGFKITVLLADAHAYLNEKGTMDEVRKIADYNKRCFIALGLDEKNTKFVLGSYERATKRALIHSDI